MGWVTTSRMRGLAAESGIWITLLVLGALAFNGPEPPRVVWPALALLAIGSAREIPRPAGVAVLLAGAGLLAFALRGVGPSWVAPAALVVALAAAVALPDFDRRRRDPALGPLLYAVSALGVYFTVPDTEEAVVLAAVAVPVGVLALPFGVRLGPRGAAAAGGLLVWVVGVGGRGREGSVVGGLCCLGLLAVEPATAWLRRSLGQRAGLRAWFAVLVYASIVHAAAVLVASRWAGLHRGPYDALAIAAPTLLAAAALAIALAPGD